MARQPSPHPRSAMPRRAGKSRLEKPVNPVLELAVEQAGTHADREEPDDAGKPADLAHAYQRVEDERDDGVVDQVETVRRITPLGQQAILARIARERNARNAGDEAERGKADAQEFPLGLREKFAADRKSRHQCDQHACITQVEARMNVVRENPADERVVVRR